MIFKIKASSFYWVRYFYLGVIYKRSTRTDSKRDALEFAKRFYDEINYKQHVGLLRGKTLNFVACARDVLKQQHYAVLSGEMSAAMAQADEYRLNKEIASYFKNYRVDMINYTLLESFMNTLIEKRLSAATISNYMGLISKTLKYAHRREYIAALPQIPKPKRVDKARAWLNLSEYFRVWRKAKQCANRTYEVRRRTLSDGTKEFFTTERIAPNVFERARLKKESELVLSEQQVSHLKKIKNTEFFRKIVISEELSDVICFMVNSFIRPSDLKFMKHKHVDIVRSEQHYLRLRLPESKKHNKPIATLSAAIRVYERICERNKLNGYGSSEDYVFSPQRSSTDTDKDIKQRNHAMDHLQKQFRVILQMTNLLVGPNSEDRSLYSLRHTSIMFRLLYGRNVDHLTLAINSRTSIDMLERFYVSHLTGEMNIDVLQSRRSRSVSKA